MAKLLIRIRPREVMEDLDLDAVRQRSAAFAAWRPTIVDNRVSDAMYVTLVLTLSEATANLLDALKLTLADLPGMRASVYVRARAEVPIPMLDLLTLQSALEPT